MSVSDTMKSLATAISSFAPTLATMLGGPLAGTAVTALESAFGLKQGAGADAVTQVVQTGSMTPDQMAAVRAADQKHAEIISQQQIDLAKLNADAQTAFAADDTADRASARALEMATHDWIPGFLAVGVTAGFFGVLGYVMHVGLKQIGTGQGGEAVLLLLGSLGTAWTAIVSYYFGSSAGARRSSEALAKIAAAP
jgi:hypothetical protein